MLVPMPEDGDRDTLLSGPQGRLLARSRCRGLAPETVCGRRALAAPAPLPDWDALAARGTAKCCCICIALRRPKRLIVFGRGILPLLGHDPPQGAPAISELAIQGRSMPLLSTYAPERLLENARLRAGLWQRWLEWTDDGVG
jgi:DNA polymerase